MTPPLALSVADRPHGDVAARDESAGPFVVNLCASTTPMALAQPKDPELKRFKFFVSRRLEDGRERFRLHMGYFETLQEAEEWVGVAREFYPGAWAGEAPGKKLRPQSSASDASRRLPPPDVAVVAASPPVSVASVDLPQAPPPAIDVPVLHAVAAAEPAEAPARPANGAAAEPVLELLEDAPHPSSASRGPGHSTETRVSRAAAAPSSSTVASSGGTAVPSGRAAGQPRSNVREVLASLDETQSTREMPRLSASPAPPPSPERNLTDSQVLRILEDRRSNGEHAEPDDGIALLKPDDTSTRRALKEAVASSQPVSFVVQLKWSVQPIDVADVPPLAIFGAYTLYTVEGSREGRRWYGLRLGFFSDAISAKQVAHYVRSEFNSVAVVPVSPQERARAGDADGHRTVSESQRAVATTGPTVGPPAASKPSPSSSKPSRPSGAKSAVRDKLPDPTAEFKLIDDLPAATPPSQPKVAKPHASAAPRRAAKVSHGRVGAREKRSAQTLEETLEILGADQLEIDGRSEKPARSLSSPVKTPARRNSPFTRFLARLSENTHKDR